MGEDSPEHLMNPSTQYSFTHLMQPSVFPKMHFHKQLDLPHPAKLPKQSAHLVDSSVFSIIHFSVHLAAPQQSMPQLSRAFLTSLFLESQISLSSWLHCPALRILPVSPELNSILFDQKRKKFFESRSRQVEIIVRITFVNNDK